MTKYFFKNLRGPPVIRSKCWNVSITYHRNSLSILKGKPMETKSPASYFYLPTTFATLHPHEKLQTIYKTVLVKTSLSSFTSQDNNGSINLSFNFIHYLNYSSYVRCSRQPIANNVAGQKIIFSDTSIEKLRISLKLIWPLKDSWVWFVLQATLPQTWTYQEIWRASKREQF